MCNKAMKDVGRGQVDYIADLNSGIIIAKWQDNGPVYVASNFVGIEPMVCGTVVPNGMQ